MKRFAMNVVAAFFAAAAGSVFADEILAIKAPADFKQAKRISFENGVFSFKGNGTIESVMKISADPAKKYRISGEFRSKDGTVPVRVYFGLIPLDAAGKQIQPYFIHVIPGSQTVTVSDAKKGDKTIIVRKAKWDVKTRFGLIVFNTQDDLSDLPNRNYAFIPLGGIRPDGENLKINLTSPLKTDIPAGTKVRQHLAGDTYIYCAGRVYTNNEWTLRSGVVSGFTKSTRSSSKFWPGTTAFRLMIHFSNAGKDSVTEFRNIKLETVE